MFRKLLRAATFVALLAVLLTAVMFWNAKTNRFDPSMGPGDPTVASAAQIKAPINLEGNWRSQGSNSLQMIAQISNNTILVQSIINSGGYGRYWFGSFENPKGNADGKGMILSKKIEVEGQFTLSPADDKQFIYQSESIYFDVSAMGVTRTVELVRA
jgi:hypothetical protein